MNVWHLPPVLAPLPKALVLPKAPCAPVRGVWKAVVAVLVFPKRPVPPPAVPIPKPVLAVEVPPLEKRPTPPVPPPLPNPLPNDCPGVVVPNVEAAGLVPKNEFPPVLPPERKKKKKKKKTEKNRATVQPIPERENERIEQLIIRRAI